LDSDVAEGRDQRVDAVTGVLRRPAAICEIGEVRGEHVLHHQRTDGGYLWLGFEGATLRLLEVENVVPVGFAVIIGEGAKRLDGVGLIADIAAHAPRAATAGQPPVTDVQAGFNQSPEWLTAHLEAQARLARV